MAESALLSLARTALRSHTAPVVEGGQAIARLAIWGPVGRSQDEDADAVLQDTILIVRDRWDQIRILEKPAAYWYKIPGRRATRLQGRSKSWKTASPKPVGQAQSGP